MRSSANHVFLVLALWQAAPIAVGTDAAGRLQVSLGYGFGGFEERSLNCAGDVVDATPHEFNTTGAKADYWVTPTFRLTAYGGRYGDSPGWGDYAVAYGGLLGAHEGKRLGLGVGVLASPFPEFDGLRASMYVRLGNRDGVHFRADVLAPSPLLGVTGDALRLGIGINPEQGRGWSAFLGYSASPYSDESHLGGVFGEFAVPIARPVDFLLSGSYRTSDSYSDYGIGAGVRVHLLR